MTPEQRARLDQLRAQRERGERPRAEPTEPPVHMNHAHWGGHCDACPPGCVWCPREEDPDAQVQEEAAND